MLFHPLALALVGSLALDAAAGPVPAPRSDAAIEKRSAGKQAHAVFPAHPDKLPVPAHAPSFSVPSAARRAIPATHALHERQPHTWAKRWSKVMRAPADAVLPMRIGLRQPRTDEGHDLLMSMVDPTSKNYGRHMSAKEVIDFFAPDRASIDAVVGWLTNAGIDINRISQSANKQWIQFDATTAEAEELLKTDFYVFEHGETGSRDVAADHYHLPHGVRDHVDYVTPGIRLRRDTGKERQLKRRQQLEANKQMKKRQAAGGEKDRRAVAAMHTAPEYIADAGIGYRPPLNSSTCYKYVTPDCIRTQYGIPKGKTATKGNELGIFESIGQHYSREDLDNYFKVVAPEIPAGTYPEDRLVDGAIGAVAVKDAGGEAELDFQAVMPLIYPQKSVLYQVDDERIQLNMTMPGSPYLGFWNTFFDAIDGSYCSYSAFGETGNCVKPECLDASYPDTLPGGYNGTLQCGVYEPTAVISISYGGGEADLPAYYWKRQCTEILKLGLQGVTTVISSGDDGVASFAFDGGNANGCGGADAKVFYPGTEATCPYVLAVGSTEFDLAEPVTPSGNYSRGSATTAHAPRLTERATARFGSGGGFSNYFPQPVYQWGAVARYFATTKLDFTGYVDMGPNFTTVGDGVYHIGGRGFPDVSAIGDHFVTILQGSWATIGGTSLAAPVWASVLTLINEERLNIGKSTLGFVNPILYQNPDMFNDITEGSNPGCGTSGFPAAKGWDPVTGLGSPNYPKLIKRLVEDLP